MADEEKGTEETSVHPDTGVEACLVSLFVAKDHLQAAQVVGKSRYKAIAVTDLEKVIAFIAMYVRND